MTGAPKDNKNAEKWTIEASEEILNKALEMSRGDEYDYIGELAKDLKISRHTFTYITEKFETLKDIYSEVLSNIEANCFKHSKKGLIKEATAIVNLKSNYGWKDRNQTDVTSGDKPLQQPITIIYKGEELDIKK